MVSGLRQVTSGRCAGHRACDTKGGAAGRVAGARTRAVRDSGPGHTVLVNERAS